MRLAISIPQFVEDGAFDSGRFRDCMTRAEALGFDSAWTQEQVLGSMPHLSPIETMTYAGACTQRLPPGVRRLRQPSSQSGPPLQEPEYIGPAQLRPSRGRHWHWRAEPNVLGVCRRSRQPRRAVRRGPPVDEALWTEFRVDFGGRFWQLHGAAMEPKPFQKPWPPIWFGGSHPAAVRRAVQYGDGFFGAGSQTTAQFADQVKVVREALAQSGRPAAEFRIAKRVYIAVDDDVARARQRISAARDQLYGYFGLPAMESVAVFGPPDACARGLGEAAEAGAGLIVPNPLFDEAEQMERLAIEVAPQLS